MLKLNFFTPNTDGIPDFYEKGKYILAWRIASIFMLFFAVIFFVNLYTNPSGVFPIFLVLLTALLGMFFLHKTKKVRLVFWIFATGGTITPLLALNFVPEYTHFVDFLWLPTCILVAFVGLGKKEGFIFVLIDIIGIGFFYIFSINRHIEVLQPRTTVELIADYAEIVFAIIIMVSFLGQFIVFQKYAEENIKEKNKALKDQNAIILSKNKENENLLKEIHHRVKNNLQIIISLLRMQSSEMKSKEAKDNFQEAINRIMAMSLIHQKLYSNKETSTVNLKSYIEELILEIIHANSLKQKDVRLSIENTIDEIDLTTLIPLGLLLNELASNTLKHSTAEDGSTEIRIKMKSENKTIYFDYADNGVWVDKEEDSNSFGLELIDILTEQMNGQKTLDITSGVKYSFILKMD